MRLFLAFVLALLSMSSTTALARPVEGVPCARAGAWHARGEMQGHNGVLLYAQQRWLDPSTGRFLSLDPVAGALDEPLSTQGFTYAHANPTRYTDPDGRLGMLATGGVGGLLGGLGGCLLGAYHASDGDGLEGCVKGGIVGATAGAIAGLTFGASLAATGSVGIGGTAVIGGGTTGSIAVASTAAGATGGFVGGAGGVLASKGSLDEALASGEEAVAVGGIVAVASAVGGAASSAVAGGGALVASTSAQRFAVGAAAGATGTVTAQAGMVAVSDDAKFSAVDVVVSALTGGAFVAIQGRVGATSSQTKTTTNEVNFRGEPVQRFDGHEWSQVDPAMSENPIFNDGPFTAEQRSSFLSGRGGATRLAPHHRHQIPVETHGGVIDEIPGPGHPAGNQHTRLVNGVNRHPGRSYFRNVVGGEAQRAREIANHWRAKGTRLVEDQSSPGDWWDGGPAIPPQPPSPQLPPISPFWYGGNSAN